MNLLLKFFPQISGTLLVWALVASGIAWHRGNVLEDLKVNYGVLTAQIVKQNKEATDLKTEKDRAVALAGEGLDQAKKNLEIANDAIAQANASEKARNDERVAAARRVRDAIAAAGGRGGDGSAADLAAARESIARADSWRAIAIVNEQLAGSCGSIVLDALSHAGTAEAARKELERIVKGARGEYFALRAAAVAAGCAKEVDNLK
jgi:hypothetical protein